MKGYKTLLFALLLGVVGVLEQFNFTEIFSGENGGIWIGVVGVVVAFLRKITDTAVGQNQ